MAGLLSIKSAFLYKLEVQDFKILFRPSFNVQVTDYNLLNTYVIYKVNQYQVLNIKDYSLQDFIQIDFMRFQVEYFDQLDNTTLRVFRDYYYLHRFQINFNLNLNKTCNIIMLEVVTTEQNNKYSLEQIKQVEERYHSLSKTT